MIFCRFQADKEPSYGIVQEHEIQEISPDPFSKFEAVSDPIPLNEAKLLAPAQPSKIIAIGVNYRAHAEEMSHTLPAEPLMFLKPPSAVIGPEEEIQYPAMSARVDYEGELAVVIKKRAKNVPEERANDFILGYTCFNDVTARDLQKKDNQWSRAKGFDTFAPLGPWIVSDLDPSDVRVETYVNGELKQSGRTSQLIYKIPFLIAHISRVMTLEPGDVITTGTPSGIGPLEPGNEVHVSIDGIGVLHNTVAKAPHAQMV